MAMLAQLRTVGDAGEVQSLLAAPLSSDGDAMIVVECPNCKRRYDPQADEALAAAGDGTEMSIKVPCPNCGQWVGLPEWECVEAPGAPPEILKQMASQSVLLPESDDSPLTFGPGGDYVPPPKKKPWWAFWR